ncbi:hypothetical protein HK104_011299 [Borealophlyctis nickersoniae]|nr:hypothetical protein HK104_011299 [Borealophlyctis nickersoniae]
MVDIDDGTFHSFVEPYVLAQQEDRNSLLSSRLVQGSPEWFQFSIIHELNAVREDPSNAKAHMEQAASLLTSVKNHIVGIQSDLFRQIHDALSPRYALAKAEIDDDWSSILEQVKDSPAVDLEESDSDHDDQPVVETNKDAESDTTPSTLNSATLQVCIISKSVKGDAEEFNLVPAVRISNLCLTQTDTVLAKLISKGNFSDLEPQALAYVANRESTSIADKVGSKANCIQLLFAASSPNAFKVPSSDGRPSKDLLPDLIANEYAKLNSGEQLSFSSSFGRITQEMTMDQLARLGELCPELHSHDHYVMARINRILPATVDDFKSDSDAFRALRAYINEASKHLPRTFLANKAAILFCYLLKSREMNIYDRDAFMEYIELPLEMQTRNKDFLQFHTIYPQISSFGWEFFPPVTGGSEEELLRDYLTHFFKADATLTIEPFKKYLDRAFLEKIYAHVKISSMEDPAKWNASLPPAQLQELSERVILEFLPYANPETIDPNTTDPVRLRLRLKNIPSLVVQLFEINTFAFHRDHAGDREALASLDVSGLTPKREQRLKFEENALRIWEKDFEFVEFYKRGIWIIEFVGGGKKLRGVISRGTLKFAETLTVSGHVLTMLDETNNRVTKDCRIHMGGHIFEPDADGDFLIPYTGSPNSVVESLLLTHGDFAYPAPSAFNHLPENYNLQAHFLGIPESIVRGATCNILVRASLFLNGVTVSLAMLEDVTLTVTTTDFDGVENVKTVEKFDLKDDVDGVYSFVVQENLQQIKFTLKANVQLASRQTGPQELTCDSEVFHVNRIEASEAIFTVRLQRIDSSYYLLALGKNGEARSDEKIDLHLKHRFFKTPIRAKVRTDQHGRAGLGLLTDITRVMIDFKISKQTVRKAWDLTAFWSVPSSLKVAEGSEIRIPFLGDLRRLQPNEWVLLRKGSRVNVADVSDLVRFEVDPDPSAEGSGCFVIPNLPEGAYELSILRPSGEFNNTQITVLKSAVSDPAALGQWRSDIIPTVSAVHEQSHVRDKAAPLRIAAAALCPDDRTKLKISIDGASDTTRVHCFVSTFLRCEGSGLRIASPPMPFSPLKESTFKPPKNIYRQPEYLSEELVYVLNRKHQLQPIGNSLAKPGLILNRRKKGETQLRDTGLDAPAPRRPAVGFGSEALMCKSSSFGTAPLTAARSAYASAYGRELEIQDDDGGYDFLGEPGISFHNLRPSADGTLTVTLPSFRGAHNVIIIAADHRDFSFRILALPHEPVEDAPFGPVRDLTLRTPWDLNAHVMEHKTISILSPGESLDVGAQVPAVVATVGRLYEIAETLSSKFDTKAFAAFRPVITQWQKLHEAQRLKMYDQYACHELNFFLFTKDRTFFDAVVAPYLKNKVEKQIVDLFLLGDVEGCRSHLQAPHKTAKLTAMERIMAAKLVGGVELEITRRWVADQLREHERGQNAAMWAKERDAIFNCVAAGKEEYQTKAALKTKKRYPVEQSGVLLFDDTEEAEDEEDEEEITENFVLPASAAFRSVQRVFERGENISALADRSAELSQASVKSASANTRAAKKFYQAPESTSAWVEQQYWGSKNVVVNAFWKDWAEHKDGPFLSQHFGESLRNGFTEAMFAIAVLGMSVDESRPLYEIIGNAKRPGSLLVCAQAPVIVFHRNIRETEFKPLSAILVSQKYIDPENSESIDPETDESYDRYIEPQSGDVFRPLRVYECQISFTNTSSVRHLLSPLVQIPQEALPVKGVATKTHRINLNPYETRLLHYRFYFPHPGSFPHYPVQVSKGEYIVVCAQPSTIVVAKAAPDAAVPDELRRTWEWVSSRQASVDDLIAWLKAPSSILPDDFSSLSWRFKDKAAWSRIVDCLRERGVFAESVWIYSLKHAAVREMKEWFNVTLNQFRNESMLFVDFAGVRFDAFEREQMQWIEHWPLINARAHQLGKRPRVNNTQFLETYKKFVYYMFQKPSCAYSSSDLVGMVCSLILQDRIDEARTQLDYLMSRIATGKLDIEGRLQLDYALAWMDLVDPDGELKEAKRVAGAYKNYKVPKWGKLFKEVQRVLSELEKEEEGISTGPKDDEAAGEDARQVAEKDALLEFRTSEGNKLFITHRNVRSCDVFFHPINLEAEFSSRPFALATAADSAALGGTSPGTSPFGENSRAGGAGEKTPASYVLPQHRLKVDLPAESGELQLAVPADLPAGTALVQLTANDGDIRKSRVWTRSNILVQVSAREGMVIVRKGARAPPSPDTGDDWSVLSSTVDAVKEYVAANVSGIVGTRPKPLPRCYVKVYAKLQSQSVVFYRDGYTDRLGRFDYASLSNTELLSTVESFAILCVGPGAEDGGAVVLARPPKV